MKIKNRKNQIFQNVYFYPNDTQNLQLSTD